MNRKEKLIYRILVTQFNNNACKPIPLDSVQLESDLTHRELNDLLQSLAANHSIFIHKNNQLSIPEDALVMD
ncbi:hypothetical protein NI389_03440 [Pseudoalteromonas xiamenensis]|uniref:hypothetical protein n=1 Tax=Pseudoalteromonas xiamenensis TaxID=882626 RepID=UPI0027E3E7F2|nr:hypothetical protein [Pseudoalteromonas xiamenensis]WMN60474.1 hypothetical protein NI389_03440 [Pseudoalteromonas xiamenensis]